MFRKQYVLALVCLTVLADSAKCHDYWLQPATFFPKVNEPLNVRLYVGDALNSEVERPFQKKVTPRFQLVSANKITNLIPKAKDGTKPQIRLSLPNVGSHFLVLERDARNITLTAEKFNNYLKHEGLDNIIEQRRKSGESDKPGREKYSRYIKCLLNAGGKSDATWKTVVKQKLEIVLLNNPTTLKIGAKLRVRILFDGQPLAGVAFFSLNKSAGKVHQQALRTNKDGSGTVPITHAGMHLIRLVHMRRCTNDAAADWESFWGALSIAIEK